MRIPRITTSMVCRNRGKDCSSKVLANQQKWHLIAFVVVLLLQYYYSSLLQCVTFTQIPPRESPSRGDGMGGFRPLPRRRARCPTCILRGGIPAGPWASRRRLKAGLIPQKPRQQHFLRCRCQEPMWAPRARREQDRARSCRAGVRGCPAELLMLSGVRGARGAQWRVPALF